MRGRQKETTQALLELRKELDEYYLETYFMQILLPIGDLALDTSGSGKDPVVIPA